MPEYTIDITDKETISPIPHPALKSAIHQVLMQELVDSASISVALVTDAEIQRINRQFLGHDYPTDVISFLLNEPSSTGSEDALELADNESAGDHHPGQFLQIDGELIVSTETAIREAGGHGWSPREELLLYVVHGLLHLCGYDDVTDESRPVMRSREREMLALWGCCPTGLEP